MTASDLNLLRQYAQHHAEDAFAEIVRRHLGLVYSAALRQVRSPQLAEEVAQSVFTDLARNAAKLSSGTGDTPVLTAWLYQVTRRTAIDVVRREARRQSREQIATEMNAMNVTTSDWTHIEPLVDEAMSALDDTDRAAVLLRYFENKSLREVGATFGTTDDAAQKRVSRAVERLREFFAKRGVTVGASGIVVVISANAVQAAPVGLAVTISAAAALAGTTIANTATITAAKTIAMTTFQKTIIGAALAAAIGTGIYEVRQASILRTQVQTLQQQQAPLAERIRQLTRNSDEAATKLATLRDANERIKSNITELPKLRGDLNRLRQQLTSQKLQISQADRPLGYIAKDKIALAGYTTPEATLETMTFTQLKGTYDQFIESLSTEMLAQEELKGTQRREMWETNKNTFAPFFKGVQILAKKVLADDRVELKYKNDLDAAINQLLDLKKSAPPAQSIVQAMVKVGNDWKMDGLPRLNEESWDDEGQIEKFAP